MIQRFLSTTEGIMSIYIIANTLYLMVLTHIVFHKQYSKETNSHFDITIKTTGGRCGDLPLRPSEPIQEEKI